jgi:hypothetical protein
VFFLPASLPALFGAELLAAELQELEGTTLARVESHCEAGKSLLLYQFRVGKPRMAALLCALLEGVQQTEDGIWSVLVGRNLDYALGVQLDGIGEVVNLPRSGWLDETYRALLRAQVLVLRSCGTWGDVHRVIVAMGLSAERFVEHFPAAIVVVLGVPTTAPNALDAFRFLERTRAAAVRLQMEFPTVEVEESFTYALTDEPELSDERGYGDAVADAVGGYYAGVFASSVTP